LRPFFYPFYSHSTQQGIQLTLSDNQSLACSWSAITGRCYVSI